MIFPDEAQEERNRNMQEINREKLLNFPDNSRQL